MDNIIIEKDIDSYSLTAASFPEGILEAHQKLHAIVPFSKERRYFGISRPENGKIKYRSAAEILEQDDSQAFGLETFTIKKGNYMYREIKNFQNNIQEIGQIFQELLQHPDLDPESYCIEWYNTDVDVKCMVKLL